MQMLTGPPPWHKGGGTIAKMHDDRGMAPPLKKGRGGAGREWRSFRQFSRRRDQRNRSDGCQSGNNAGARGATWSQVRDAEQAPQASLGNGRGSDASRIIGLRWSFFESSQPWIIHPLRTQALQTLIYNSNRSTS